MRLYGHHCTIHELHMHIGPAIDLQMQQSCARVIRGWIYQFHMSITSEFSSSSGLLHTQCSQSFPIKENSPRHQRMFILLMIRQCIIGKSGDIDIGKEGLGHIVGVYDEVYWWNGEDANESYEHGPPTSCLASWLVAGGWWRAFLTA